MTDISTAAGQDSTPKIPAPTSRAMWRERLGRVGVWSMELRTAPAQAIEHAAHDLDGAGFRALWIPGLDGGQVFADAQRLLTATQQASVVIGVQSIWKQEPTELAERTATVESRFPGRLLTGLGVGAAEVAHAIGKPFSTAVKEMANYCKASTTHRRRFPSTVGCWVHSGPKWPHSPEPEPQDYTHSSCPPRPPPATARTSATTPCSPHTWPSS